jgi:Uma2 family endonuclease
VVEIADTSQAYDLGRKAEVYAAAGIEDYWVVLPAEREIVVCRDRQTTSASSTGWAYAERAFRPGETIAPLAMPAHPVAVADLLP